MNKELFTDRLRLIPVEFQHDNRMLELLRNDAIKKYLCDNRQIEKDAVRSMIRESNSLFEKKGIGLWLIKEAENKYIVGFCGFFINDALEILYVIDPHYQNRGYATESILKVMDFFRQQNPSEVIHARVDAPNLASHRVAQKIGMRALGSEQNTVTGGEMTLYQLDLATLP